jgi:uncharacterized membrane protein YbhN (UPF0104 family)
MGTDWISLIVFQSLAVVFNILLLNNITDKNFIYLSIFFTLFYKSALEAALFDEISITGQGSFAFSFWFSVLIACIFMYINKRVHKEVFLEHK